MRILLLAIAFVGISTNAQIPGFPPPSPRPICWPDGYACTFNSDCCQGKCKNFLVCDSLAPVSETHVACQTNDECTEGYCDIDTNECTTGS